MINIQKKRAVRHVLAHKDLKSFDIRLEIFSNNGVVSDLPDTVVLLYMDSSNDYQVFPDVDSCIKYLNLNYLI